MGVTLYTLVFGENPFYDVDETLKCVLKPPFNVSQGRYYLLCILASKDINPALFMSITYAFIPKMCVDSI